MRTMRRTAMLLTVLCVMGVWGTVGSALAESVTKPTLEWLTNIEEVKPLGEVRFNKVREDGKLVLDYYQDPSISDKFGRIVFNQDGTIYSAKQNLPIPCDHWKDVKGFNVLTCDDTWVKLMPPPDNKQWYGKYISDNNRNIYIFQSNGEMSIIVKFNSNMEKQWEYRVSGNKHGHSMHFLDSKQVFYVVASNRIYEHSATTGNLLRTIIVPITGPVDMDTKGHFYITDDYGFFKTLRWIREWDNNGNFCGVLKTTWLTGPKFSIYRDTHNNCYMTIYGQKDGVDYLRLRKYNHNRCKWNVKISDIDDSLKWIDILHVNDKVMYFSDGENRIGKLNLP